MRLSEATAVLNAEVKWCKEHPDSLLSDDYQRGFIKGLEQAKLLLTKMAEAEYAEVGVQHYGVRR